MLCRYAVIGHEPGAMLLMAVAQQALLQLDSFSPQELTNMVQSSLTVEGTQHKRIVVARTMHSVISHLHSGCKML